MPQLNEEEQLMKKIIAVFVLFCLLGTIAAAGYAQEEDEIQRLFKEKRHHQYRETFWGVLFGISGGIAVGLSALLVGEAVSEYEDVSGGIVAGTVISGGIAIGTLIPAIHHAMKKGEIEDRLKEIELKQKVSLAVFLNKNEQVISLRYHF